ncbi:MAG: hypothetical protein LBV04_03445 [Deferribacteraceae bacterium]|nr:hypothetical protein [Deferribacteraceae bacterium]
MIIRFLVVVLFVFSILVAAVTLSKVNLSLSFDTQEPLPPFSHYVNIMNIYDDIRMSYDDLDGEYSAYDITPYNTLDDIRQAMTKLDELSPEDAAERARIMNLIIAYDILSKMISTDMKKISDIEFSTVRLTRSERQEVDSLNAKVDEHSIAMEEIKTKTDKWIHDIAMETYERNNLPQRQRGDTGIGVLCMIIIANSVMMLIIMFLGERVADVIITARQWLHRVRDRIP